MGRLITSEMCTKCGGCCRNNPFVELSENEIGALSLFTGLESESFADTDRGANPRRFLKFQESGNCIFLRETDGNYACSVYEARPSVCRNYPFTTVEDDICSQTWLKSLPG